MRIMHSAETTRFPRFGRPLKDDAAARRQVASARVSLEEPADADRLLALSKADAGDALGAVLRTAWALLLRCYTGQDHVSFGFFQHVGSDPDGPQPVAARFLLHDSMSVSEALGCAKTETTAVSASVSDGDHSDLPDPIAVFNTIIVLWGFASTPTSALPPKLDQNHQLRLLVKKNTRGNLGLFLEWDGNLTGMPTAQGILVASTLAKIISSLVSSPPNTRLSGLDCLSHANLNQINTWNEACPIEPLDRCIHHVIADRVLEQPDAEAVCAWDGSFTYRELDDVTSSLAARLVQLGVCPEALIPLCFEKSVCTRCHPQLTRLAEN